MSSETEVKERPILFSAPMVRAILDGRKTQTRRIVKPQPRPHKGIASVPGDFAFFNSPGCWTISCKPNGPDGWAEENSPYGQPGDRLWVRETWGVAPGYDNTPPRDLKPHGMKVNYSADGALIGCKSRPSIHMPRWASRILLEITSVRVEQLQDISPTDCIAEGCRGGHGSIPGYLYSATEKEHYKWLWESINGHESWYANPWVWVVEFKRVEPKEPHNDKV